MKTFFCLVLFCACSACVSETVIDDPAQGGSDEGGSTSLGGTGGAGGVDQGLAQLDTCTFSCDAMNACTAIPDPDPMCLEHCLQAVAACDQEGLDLVVDCARRLIVEECDAESGDAAERCIREIACTDFPP